MASVTEASGSTPKPRSFRRTLEWQRRLLPLMVAALLVLAAMACVSNLYQVGIVQRHIQDHQDLDFASIWRNLDSTPAGSSFAYAQWKAAVMLESGAMQRRYHQASAMTMTRVYIIFLGFMTGMVMALIGATFILGKLDAQDTRVEAEAQGWKLASTGLADQFTGRPPRGARYGLDDHDYSGSGRGKCERQFTLHNKE